MIFDDEVYKNQNVLKKASEHFMDLDVHNSTALEGNTLTRAEVSVFLENGITVHGKKFNDFVEVKNYNETLIWLKKNIQNRDLELSILLIKKIHFMVTNGVLVLEDRPEENFSGRFRDDVVFLRTTTHVPPDSDLIEGLLEKEIEDYYQRLDSGYGVLESACIFHRQFERIHPFFDGNGRTGRILLNLLIIQDGYPFLTIGLDDRVEYFEALENDCFYEFATRLMAKLYDGFLNTGGMKSFE